MGENQPSAINPTFLEIAVPLAERGIPVIPVEPCEKRCLLPDWQRRATTSAEQIARWNAENPNYNVGCVAKPDGIVVLDCDVKGLMRRIEEETGHKFPDTLVVRSAGKGCAHIYLLQTELSRKLGNRKAAGLFDLQSVDKYVVGPQSRLDNGNTYDAVKDFPIAPFPDWLYDWVLAHADQPKKGEGKDARTVDDEFDFGDFCDWYDISGQWDGEWFITDACPVAGYKHEQSTRTGFYFDGGRLGFHCFASGCEGSGMTVGQVIRFLNRTHEPYSGVIWEADNADLLNDPRFAVEDADLAENPPTDNDPPAKNDPAAATGVGTRLDAEGAAAILNDDAAADMDAAWADRAEELNPAPLPAPDDIDAIVNAPQAESLAFDGRALYGRLGETARAAGLPLGWMYPALLGMASALDIRAANNEVRANMFVALIAPVGTAKTVVLDAADKSIFLPELTKVYTTPASDRGLVKLLGEDGNTVMLIEDEFRSVLSKCQVPNSNLAQVICKLWSKDPGGRGGQERR